MNLELLVKSYGISIDDIEEIIGCEDVLAEWTNMSLKYQLAIAVWLYNELRLSSEQHNIHSLKEQDNAPMV